MPHKQAAACTACAPNKACSCLFAQEPAQDKQRTANVTIGQFAEMISPQPQNERQLRVTEDGSVTLQSP